MDSMVIERWDAAEMHTCLNTSSIQKRQELYCSRCRLALGPDPVPRAGCDGLQLKKRKFSKFTTYKMEPFQRDEAFPVEMAQPQCSLLNSESSASVARLPGSAGRTLLPAAEACTRVFSAHQKCPQELSKTSNEGKTQQGDDKSLPCSQ